MFGLDSWPFVMFDVQIDTTLRFYGFYLVLTAKGGD